MLTPDRAEKRQNGRRMKEAGEPMFTLTAQDQHGVYLPEEVSGDADMALPVRNGTKQGYDLAYPGDGVCLSYPKSESRRGRVGKGCSQTLDTGCMMGTVTKCGRIRRLTPRECFRLQGFPDELYERAAAVNSEHSFISRPGMRSRRRWLMRLPWPCRRAGSFWRRWKRYGKSLGILCGRLFREILMILCRGRRGRTLAVLCQK